MRDFPIFTTEYGVSSLILREIPYRNEAYIRIRDVQPGMLEPHLRECASFCRMAGAERVFAAGEGLEACPKAAAVLQMRGIARVDKEQVACLFPVTENTASQWREIYQKTMAKVDNASTLEKRDEAKLLESAGAYFVHERGELLGIGWLHSGKVLAIAAVQKGAGTRVMHSLMSIAEGEELEIEVASTNEKAIALYERLGFVKTQVLTQWYLVTNL